MTPAKRKSPFARKPYTLKADRNLELTRAVLDGGNLRGLGIMYGISAERVRQLYQRTIERLAEDAGVPVPTIREARRDAALWRGRIIHDQFAKGFTNGNT